MTFDNNAKPSRRLVYPLTLSETIDTGTGATGTITKVTADFFPEDPDERIDVIFNLSFNEFTTLASAIDIGRDIGYGTQSALVWWTWIRSLIGTGGAMTCEDVEDCFEAALTTNQDFRTFMYNYINSAGYGDPNHIDAINTKTIDRNPSGFENEEIKELEHCNLDALWGGLRHGIVSRLDDRARDLLEDLAAIPNTIERLAVFIDTIPVIGDIAEGLAFQITEVIPDVIDLYNAYSSEETLDEIACELFALVCASCRYPTFEEVFQRYATHAIGVTSLTTATLEQVCEFILELIGNPAEAAYNTIIIWQLFILNAQAAFGSSSGTAALTRDAAVGEDFGSNNWFDLCDACNEPYMRIEYDFTAGMHNWYLDAADGIPNEGTYVAGKGWMLTSQGGNMRAEICMILEPEYEFRAIAWHTTQTGLLGARSACLRPTAGLTTSQNCVGISNGSGDWDGWHCSDGLAGVTGYNEIAIAAQSINVSQTIYIDKIIIIVDAPAAPANSQPTADNTICV